MKINILIIEDEFLMREQLSKIDFSSTGATLSGIFADTKSAWDFASRNHPDILITDIQLNGENGLDFAKKLKSRLPKLKIIVLTAHNILEYTKAAIAVGVMAYLLKPIDKDQLIGMVQDAAAAVRKDREVSKNNRIVSALKDNSFLFKSYFLSACGEKEQFDKIYDLFDLPKSETMCAAIVTEFYDEKDHSPDFSNICSLIEADDCCQKLVPFYEPTLLTFFIKFNFMSAVDATLQHCINIATTIKKYLDFNYSSSDLYSIGIGEIRNNASDFGISYKSAINCLEHSFYMGKNQIIYCQDVEPATSIIVYKEYINQSILLLKIGDYEGTMAIVDKLFSFNKENPVSMNIVQRICLEYIVNISTALIQIGQDPDFLFNKFNIWAYLQECKTVDTLKSLIVNLVTTSIAQINDVRSTKNSTLIANVTEYINKNYTQPLSLENVAKKFYISSCYLSTMFKKETNMNFKEYIRALKINKAKELLKTTNKSIQEISQELGYNSSSYFSKAFHNETGLIPSEYRHSNATQSGE